MAVVEVVGHIWPHVKHGSGDYGASFQRQFAVSAFGAVSVSGAFGLRANTERLGYAGRSVACRAGGSFEGLVLFNLGVLAITLYQRLLEELKPDHVHILAQGRIIASGGPELADRLEIEGYARFVAAAAP